MNKLTALKVVCSITSVLLLIVAVVIFTMPESSTPFAQSSCRFEPYLDGRCKVITKGISSQNMHGTTANKYSFRVYDESCGSQQLSLDDGKHQKCTDEDLETTYDNACWTECDSKLYVLDDPTPEEPNMTAGVVCLTLGLVIIFLFLVEWGYKFLYTSTIDDRPTYPSISPTPKSANKHFFFETDSGNLDRLPATYVATKLLQVHEEYSLDSNPVCQIQEGTPLLIDEINGDRAHISSPVKGWVSLRVNNDTLLERRHSRRR